ncbi:MAG: hypothetical protein ACOZJZ_06605, partial [Pseudomonadota bacterium]
MKPASHPPTVAPPSSFGGSTGHPSFADTMQAAARTQGGAPVGGPFDVCHAGLALRAVLYVQGVLAVGCLLAAVSWSHA